MNNYYSNIYWHFTGSPKGVDWHNISKPSDITKDGRRPKKDVKALDIAVKIIQSKKLIALSREKLDNQYFTDKFCCVTDIPIQNLKEHCKYYGNVALGFNSKKVHKEFNPVLYINRKSLPKKINPTFFAIMAMSGNPYYIPKQFPMMAAMSNDYSTNRPIEIINKDIVTKFIANHIKITDFSINKEDTFYREREWRKTSDFVFEPKDIAAVIVPQKLLRNIYSQIKKNNLIYIPILTWELLDTL